MGFKKDEDGSVRVEKTSGLDPVVSDIAKPAKARRGLSGLWIGVLLQIAFGYVGAGYFYFNEKAKGLASLGLFILGVLTVIYLEMQVFPSESQINYELMWEHNLATGIFALLAFIAYPVTVMDCYFIGTRLQQKGEKFSGYGTWMTRQPAREESLERTLGEFDRIDKDNV